MAQLDVCGGRISELHGFLSEYDIKSLLQRTNYNRRELYVVYVRFKVAS
jgi:hypothetical protein